MWAAPEKALIERIKEEKMPGVLGHQQDRHRGDRRQLLAVIAAYHAGVRRL